MSANLNSESDGSRTASEEYHIGKIPELAATSLKRSCKFLSDVLEVAVRLKRSVSACECTDSKGSTHFFTSCVWVTYICTYVDLEPEEHESEDEAIGGGRFICTTVEKIENRPANNNAANSP
jgi:hypothetical protein